MEFNERRFVNCHAFGSLEEIIRRIEEIDQNDALYESILSEPFFPDNRVPEGLTDEAVLAQFRHIFSQDKAAARRRNDHVWGRMYEERRRREVQTRPSIKEKVKGGLRVLKRGLRSAAPK
jgi:alpha(1,3/1,4) fucosyltransferase